MEFAKNYDGWADDLSCFSTWRQLGRRITTSVYRCSRLIVVLYNLILCPDIPLAALYAFALFRSYALSVFVFPAFSLRLPYSCVFVLSPLAVLCPSGTFFPASGQIALKRTAR